MIMVWLTFILALLLAVVSSVSVTVPDLSAEKVVLLHMHNDAPFFEQLGALTLSNKLRYAARHQYEVATRTPAGSMGLWQPVPCTNARSVKRGDGDGDRNCFEARHDFAIDARAPTFGKIKLALAACVGRPDYWMLWTDADALVVNQSLPLSSVIDDRYNMMISVDWLMINAGMILFKCSPWTEKFLKQVYEASEFDDARALDQSAFQHFIDELPDAASHIGYAPKHRINTYPEEYRPGDFLVHMAGKLYEATTAGANAIAHQFDVLSMVDDVRDVDAFFKSQYLLSKYSGVCTREGVHDSACKPSDPDRLKLDEPLAAMSSPNRYRHVGMRYHWLGDWKDIYDTADWDSNRQIFAPNGSATYSLLNAVPADKKEAEDDDDYLIQRRLRDASDTFLQKIKYEEAANKEQTIHDEL